MKVSELIDILLKLECSDAKIILHESNDFLSKKFLSGLCSKTIYFGPYDNKKTHREYVELKFIEREDDLMD